MVFTFQIYCSHKAISSNEIENAHRTEEIKHTISQSISHVRRSHHNWFRKTKQNKNTFTHNVRIDFVCKRQLIR